MARNRFLRPWGACKQGGHCGQGPRRGTSRAEVVAGLLRCPPAPATQTQKREKPGGFCRSCPLLSPVVKTTGLGISQLLKWSSPAMQRMPHLGAAHACQLRSAARAACSQGHGLLNRCSLALTWWRRAVDKAVGTKQSRHEPGHEEASPLTSAIKNGGSHAHQRREGHLQEIQFTPCLLQRGLVTRVKGSFLFFWLWRGPQGLLPPCMLKPGPGGRWRAGGGGTPTLPPPSTVPSPKVRCFTVRHVGLFYGLMLRNTVQGSLCSKMLH